MKTKTWRWLTCVALLAGLVGLSSAQSAEERTASGKISAVDPEQSRLTLQIEGQEKMVFQIPKGVKISRDGEPADLSSIQAGEQAEITFLESGKGPRVATSVELKSA